MIMPSALNVLTIGFSVLIFSFFWRMLAARLSQNGYAIGDAMAVVL